VQGFDSSAAAQARLLSLQQLLTFDTGISLVQAAQHVTGQAIQDGLVLANALKNIPPIQTVFPAKNGLASQLKQVAQGDAARSALNINRQIFFCSQGGFDTHSDQLTAQAGLLTQLSQAMSAFYQATQELGVANNVTTFTLSEFSRTFQPGSECGHGPRVGWAPIGAWRRREGEFDLWNDADPGAERADDTGQQRTVDSGRHQWINMRRRWRRVRPLQTRTCLASFRTLRTLGAPESRILGLMPDFRFFPMAGQQAP